MGGWIRHGCHLFESGFEEISDRNSGVPHNAGPSTTDPAPDSWPSNFKGADSNARALEENEEHVQ